MLFLVLTSGSVIPEKTFAQETLPETISDAERDLAVAKAKALKEFQKNQDAQRRLDELKKDVEKEVACVDRWGPDGIQISCIFHQFLATIGTFMIQLLGNLLWLMATIFEMSLKLAVTKISEIFGITGVAVGWKTARDLSNLFFIFILLYIAIATTLQLPQVNPKQAIVKLILAALFINFSGVITKAIVDAGNVPALYLYERAKNGMDLSDRVMNGLGLVKLTRFIENKDADYTYTDEDGNPIDADLATQFPDTTNLVIQIMGSLVFILVACFVLGSAGVMVMLRTIHLLFLYILSPFAFFFFAAPSSNIPSMWSKKLFEQVFFLVAFLVMFLMSLDVIDGMGLSSVSNTASLTSTTHIIFFIIAVGLMIGSLVISSKMGAAGANKAMSVGQGLQRGVTNYAKRRARQAGNTAVRGAKSAAGLAGRQTFGHVANKLARADSLPKILGSKSLKDRAAVGGIKGALARKVLQGANSVAGASFGGAAGGYNAALDRDSKKKKEHYDNLGKVDTQAATRDGIAAANERIAALKASGQKVSDTKSRSITNEEINKQIADRKKQATARQDEYKDTLGNERFFKSSGKLARSQIDLGPKKQLEARRDRLEGERDAHIQKHGETGDKDGLARIDADLKQVAEDLQGLGGGTAKTSAETTTTSAAAPSSPAASPSTAAPAVPLAYGGPTTQTASQDPNLETNADWQANQPQPEATSTTPADAEAAVREDVAAGLDRAFSGATGEATPTTAAAAASPVVSPTTAASPTVTPTAGGAAEGPTGLNLNDTPISTTTAPDESLDTDTADTPGTDTSTTPEPAVGFSDADPVVEALNKQTQELKRQVASEVNDLGGDRAAGQPLEGDGTTPLAGSIPEDGQAAEELSDDLLKPSESALETEVSPEATPSSSSGDDHSAAVDNLAAQEAATAEAVNQNTEMDAILAKGAKLQSERVRKTTAQMADTLGEVAGGLGDSPSSSGSSSSSRVSAKKVHDTAETNRLIHEQSPDLPSDVVSGAPRPPAPPPPPPRK